jgi:hypothetical protein
MDWSSDSGHSHRVSGPGHAAVSRFTISRSGSLVISNTIPSPVDRICELEFYKTALVNLNFASNTKISVIESNAF